MFASLPIQFARFSYVLVIEMPISISLQNVRISSLEDVKTAKQKKGVVCFPIALHKKRKKNIHINTYICVCRHKQEEKIGSRSGNGNERGNPTIKLRMADPLTHPLAT